MPEISSTLDSVTVFLDRARVTRRGRVTLEPGQHRLEFAGLPISLFPESLRAAGHGTARARLLGVSAAIVQLTESPAETVRGLEAKIQAVSDSDADLAAQAEVLDKEQKALDGLAGQSEVFARGLALRNRTTADQGAVYDFITGRGRTLQADVLALGRRRRDLARELDRLQRELAQLQAARPRQRYTAVVEVEVSAPGELEVELSYVVQPGSWKPLYDLRLSGAELELTYLAEVTQSTGEDWAGVALTLSTAQPALALVIPELDPWYVGQRILVTRAPTRSPHAQAGAAPKAAFLAAEAAEETPGEEIAFELPAAEVSESGASLTYGIAGRADVPSGGASRKVTVAGFRLHPDLDGVTAPKNEPVCYRRARVRNDSPYTLLPGRAQIFEGDDYLGATRIGHVAPGQELELALGADERIRVERKLIARGVEKTLLADRRRVRYKYRIEVENLRDTPQTVTVRDQLPVARHEQIKVKLEAAAPAPTRHSELNQLEWKLTLAPAASQVIEHEASVEFPRTLDIVGLE